MTELLPCPFCGQPGYLDSYVAASGMDVWTVGCSTAKIDYYDDDAPVRVCHMNPCTAGIMSRAQAIEWWNTRHTGEQKPEGMSRSQSRRIAIQTDLPEFVYVYAESAAKYETLSCSKSPN